MACSAKLYLYCCVCRQAGWFLAAIVVLIPGACLRGQSGITNEGPFTVFRTGTNEPLLTLSLPFSPPPTNSPSLLRFDFGFATAEPEAPETFFDSFSVTLQRNDQSVTALLLTADRTGVQWAPSNPGGLTLDPTDVQHADAPFPNLTPSLALKFAYSLTFALPALFAGGPLTLFLDLFDNLNAAGSLAFVQNVRIETATQPTRLLSSTAVTGPYAEETGAVLDEINRIFALPKPSANRFYLVQADQLTRITRIRVEGSELTVEYQLELPTQPTLLTSGAVTGPFSAGTNTVWNSTNRTFTLPKPSTNWFFRIAGDRTTKIVGIRVVGAQVVVEYQFVSLKLHSAAAVAGPYLEPSNVTLNETNRAFTVNQPAGTGFYRVFSDVPTRLKSPRASGGQLVLEYEFNP